MSECSLKRAFDSLEEAEAVEKYGVEYQAYECPKCGKIHIEPVPPAENEPEQ